MSAERPYVVVNPAAGSGRSGRMFAEVRPILERRLGPLDVAFTERSGHAIDLARAAARIGVKLVIAVGGDGTLHEVANGILDAGVGGATALGYVGQGTGGDFRRSLGIEHRLDAYLDAIAGSGQRVIDVGRVRYRSDAGTVSQRWFINILSAGMGGLVVRYVGNSSSFLGGTAAYFWASVRALAACQRGILRCETNLGGATERRTVESFMIAVCNGRYFGSGMHVAPMAKLDDGFFVVGASMPRPNSVSCQWRGHIYSATIMSPNSAGARHFECDRIAMDLENEGARSMFLLEVDGEALGGLPIEVELVRSCRGASTVEQRRRVCSIRC